jgi:starch phosphorylase
MYGIFDQEIWNGQQIEKPDPWLLEENPWGLRKDFYAQSVYFGGKPIPAKNSHNDEIFSLENFEEVRATPYDFPITGYSEKADFSVLSLRLWSTNESPHNFQLQKYNAGYLDQAYENTSLTDVLYPNDNHEMGKRVRLKQEFLLVSASLQDLLSEHVKTYGDVSQLTEKVQIQMNETHAALTIAELIRRLTTYFDVPWKKAIEMTQLCCNYTNHTILREALEEWNEKRVENLLPIQHKIIQKLNQELCNSVRKSYPNDEEKIQRMSMFDHGQIKMAHLALFGCHKINGVAHLHTEILEQQVFKDFYDIFPEKFVSITNGVSQRRWLLHCNPTLSKFISDRIGSHWICDFSQIKNLASFAQDKKSQEEFLTIKKQNKQRLLDFLSKENPIRDDKGRILSYSPVLTSDALFSVQIKRFHEYKRQLLNALHVLMLYQELKKDPKARKISRMVLVGGKSAPGYELAKDIIFLFSCLSRKINSDPDVKDKLILTFVENYNVSKAELIIPAADLSEQLSCAGNEASGTGNMKMAMNGGLTIGTADGANIEMKQAVSSKWWPFSFGYTSNELKKFQENGSSPSWDVYQTNEKIKNAVNALIDDSLTNNETEKKLLQKIFDSLINEKEQKAVDHYFVLSDLQSYYDCQKKAEDLFLTPYKWAEYAINNIASMGQFSSDVVVENYVKKIWKLDKCKASKDLLEEIRLDFFDFFS